MADSSAPTPTSDDADRNGVDESFRALLEGLRTTLPGVQVLFAFLLTIPFQGAFADLRGIELGAFYVAFFATAVSSILLIAPSAHQRLRAPLTGVARRSASHLAITVKLTIVGTVTFAVALAASVFLVSTLVFDDLTGSIAASIVTLLAAWSWFYLPLVTFRNTD